MEKIHRNFLAQRWLECNTDGHRKQFDSKSAENSTSKYPVYEPTTHSRIKLSAIYATDYLQLMLDYYQSYQSVYHVDRVYNALAGKPFRAAVTGCTRPADIDAEHWTKLIEREKEKSKRYKAHRFDYEKMAMKLPQLEAAVDRNAKICPITAVEPIELRFDAITNNVAITSRYRNDVKYFIKLNRLIHKLCEEYGDDVFGGWIRVIGEETL